MESLGAACARPQTRRPSSQTCAARDRQWDLLRDSQWRRVETAAPRSAPLAYGLSLLLVMAPSRNLGANPWYRAGMGAGGGRTREPTQRRRPGQPVGANQRTRGRAWL